MTVSSFTSGCRVASKLGLDNRAVTAHALNVGTGSGGYEERHENNDQSSSLGEQHSDASFKRLYCMDLINTTNIFFLGVACFMKDKIFPLWCIPF